MLRPPPMPAWDHLHPIVVHFPIALLLMAPAFVLLALFWRAHTKPLLTAACVMIVIGAVAAQIAVMTGEATDEITQTAVLAEPVLERHEELAETARTIFLILAGVAVAGTGAVWWLGSRVKPRMILVGGLVYTAAHMLGGVVLVNAAHEGGRVVHEFGTAAWAKDGVAAPMESPENDDD